MCTPPRVVTLSVSASHVQNTHKGPSRISVCNNNLLSSTTVNGGDTFGDSFVPYTNCFSPTRRIVFSVLLRTHVRGVLLLLLLYTLAMCVDHHESRPCDSRYFILLFFLRSDIYAVYTYISFTVIS